MVNGRPLASRPMSPTLWPGTLATGPITAHLQVTSLKLALLLITFFPAFYFLPWLILQPGTDLQIPATSTSNKNLFLGNTMNTSVNNMTNNSSSTGGGGVNNSEQPDPDFIKMFVGQIPRSMDENDLRKMFEEFGRVHQINVLRDKVTGQSKGRNTTAL
ncbi:hypothetical protein C0J52_05014 [Blattella germanica]|nr:hypothetical protein C0J52_05014 [Blattella germanica]